jgi:hypothetical protein
MQYSLGATGTHSHYLLALIVGRTRPRHAREGTTGAGSNLTEVLIETSIHTFRRLS